MQIADGLGLFDGEDPDSILMFAKKQKIRYLLSHETDQGERAIRSVRIDNGRVYVDIFNVANLHEVNLLIQAENKRIVKSKRIISGLKRVKYLMQGQISLDELYGDVL